MTKWDFLILGVITGFGLIGLIRGFVVELFEAIGIVCSIMFARRFAVGIAPHMPGFVPDYMRIPLLTFVFSVLILFVIKALGGMISKAVKKSPLKKLNTFLGMIGGAGKGVVVVVLVIALLSLTTISRILALSPPNAPVLQWSLAASRPILGYYGAQVESSAQAELQKLTKQMLTPTLGADGGVVATPVDGAETPRPKLPPITDEERAAIKKLQQDPSIKELHLNEDQLRELAKKLNDVSPRRKH